MSEYRGLMTFDEIEIERLEKQRDELLEALEFAQRELDFLYHYAISNGAHKVGNPSHKIIQSVINKARKVK